MSTRLIPSVALACILAPSALAQSGNSPTDWAPLEAPILTGHVRLTSPEQFIKAGEAYYSPDASRIIFQAIEHPPEGQEPSPHYAMYVADLARDDNAKVTGLTNITRISKEGSANTCGWFHPTEPGRILFGSTITSIVDEHAPGYRRDKGKYTWKFPNEMEIVTTVLPDDLATTEVETAAPIWERDGYDAEASWSPDGRFILYTRLEPSKDDAEPNGDIWVYDTLSNSHTALVTQPGYDGGPFFSEDGQRIIYRSDRRLDNLLQLYIAELKFDETGAIVGLKREIPLSDNEHVNWCPYLNASGDIALFATSEVGHFNYEVFAVEAGTSGLQDKPADNRIRVRVTRAGGFDGLPVFSPDGTEVMWTSQRALADADPEEHIPTSQLWIARYDETAVRRAMFDAAMKRASELAPGN